MSTAASKKATLWTCVGESLSYQTADGKWRKARVVHEPNEAAIAPMAVGDAYDMWCESGSNICRRTITDYIHESKGNVVYGNGGGAIGEFDQIIRVELNGRSPRMRGTFIWDSGPKITFSGVRLTCREEQTGPNPKCGAYAPDVNQNGAFAISRSDQKDAGRWINGKPVEDDGRYYIESVGSFTPSGYPKVGMPQLKTSLWTCKRSWSPDCEFP